MSRPAAPLYWNLKKFKSGKMTAVATSVVKLTDGTIPVFGSSRAAYDYIKEHFGKWSDIHPYGLRRLTKRHKLMDDLPGKAV